MTCDRIRPYSLVKILVVANLKSEYTTGVQLYDRCDHDIQPVVQHSLMRKA